MASPPSESLQLNSRTKPRNSHTKWINQTGKYKYHVISLTYGIKKKKRYKWTYIQNRNRPTAIENTYSYQREKRGRDKLGVWD